jgi:hypothetical protein
MPTTAYFVPNVFMTIFDLKEKLQKW